MEFSYSSSLARKVCHLMLFPRLVAGLIGLFTASACTATPNLPPVQPFDAASLTTIHYKSVLIAGDNSLPVFDNAVDGVAARLREHGAAAPDALQRLGAASAVVAQESVRSATLDHVLDAIRTMRPGVGEGCFVFATSHGAPYRGLALTKTGEMLNPAALDRALTVGCGNAPTVVIVSGCFSGNFTQTPMARANRVILTASRSDRASFGCGSGRTYTFYDRCLLDALDQASAWPRAYVSVQRCVADEEHKGRFQRSEPQAYFGPAVAGLSFPVADATPPKREHGSPNGYAGNALRAPP